MEKSVGRAWYTLLVLVSFTFGISLEEAERLALKNFKPLLMEKVELLKKTTERKDRLGRFLPQINAEISLNLAREQSFSLRLPNFPPQEFVFQKKSYVSFVLHLSQDIFNLRSYREYRSSAREERAQKFLLKAKEQETLYKVREAYINALKARATIRTLEKHLELVNSHLSNVYELYREGIVPLKDVLETRVRLQEVREKLAEAKAHYSKALNYLSYFTSGKPEHVEDIFPSRNLKLIKMSEGELISTLEKNSPLLNFLREGLKIADIQREVAYASFYPVAVLEAFYQRTEESDLFPKNRYLVSFALRWNLFSGFRKLRALELSELNRKSLRLRYEDTLRKLKLKVRNILEELKAVRERVELAKLQIEDAREHLKMAQEKYRAGLGTNTDVLDAQSYLIEGESALSRARYELLLLEFKLREVTGYE